jgi:hypothetical protein
LVKNYVISANSHTLTEIPRDTKSIRVDQLQNREHMVDPSIHEELNKKNSKLLIKRMDDNQKKTSYSSLANQDILPLEN